MRNIGVRTPRYNRKKVSLFYLTYTLHLSLMEYCQAKIFQVFYRIYGLLNIVKKGFLIRLLLMRKLTR
jgi:hypothetical protein